MEKIYIDIYMENSIIIEIMEIITFLNYGYGYGCEIFYGNNCYI